MSEPRYAIYFTPTDQKTFWDWGSSVIGYDSLEAKSLPVVDDLGLSHHTWADITREPRRYGFHATLKAPFRLSGQRTEDQLRAHFRSIVTAEHRLMLDALQVEAIGSFIALTIKGDTRAVSQLAFRIVEAFEQFRAPLNDNEIARRLRSPLNDRQRRNLDIYGYPHVGEEYRFHMTLTGAIDDEHLRSDILAKLVDRYHAIADSKPIALSLISLLKQESADRPFRIIEQYRLAT